MQSVAQQELFDIAEEYRLKGYQVIIDPTEEDLPPFLVGLRPELIVRNERESIVVEVASKVSLRQSDRLIKLAEALQNRPGWSLELAMVPSPREELTGIPLDESDISDRLREV